MGEDRGSRFIDKPAGTDQVLLFEVIDHEPSDADQRSVAVLKPYRLTVTDRVDA